MMPAQVKELTGQYKAWAGSLAAQGLLAGGEKLTDDGGQRLKLWREDVLTTLHLMFTAGLRGSGRQPGAWPPGDPDSGESAATRGRGSLTLFWEAIRLARAHAGGAVTCP
jgi:hypothetical protein